jgi:DNA polymerase-1
LLPFNDKLTGTGRPQVDEDVVTRLIKLGTPGASEFEELMAIKSARSKWYSAWPGFAGTDGRLRPSFKQGYVVSGRLSAEHWQSHAIPHDYHIPGQDRGVVPIRFGLTAGEGYGLFEVDVSQAEIRVATCVAKCGPMYRQIKKGIDSHSAAALLMFYPKGTSLQEAMKDPQWTFYRGVPAKRSNLGILYGGGVGAIKASTLKFTGIEYPDDTVREWIREWRAAFPPFVRALDDYNDLASRQGWVRLVDGSKRYFSEWEPTHKAFNQRVQGDVAIAIEIAMIEFDRQFPGMLLLQVHDSLVAEIPLDRVEEVTTAMQRILVETFERLFRPVPFEADVKPFGRTAYEQKEVA